MSPSEQFRVGLIAGFSCGITVGILLSWYVYLTHLPM